MGQVSVEENSMKEVKCSAAERRVCNARQRSRCYYNPHPASAIYVECSPLSVHLLSTTSHADMKHQTDM